MAVPSISLTATMDMLMQSMTTYSKKLQRKERQSRAQMKEEEEVEKRMKKTSNIKTIVVIVAISSIIQVILGAVLFQFFFTGSTSSDWNSVALMENNDAVQHVDWEVIQYLKSGNSGLKAAHVGSAGTGGHMRSVKFPTSVGQRVYLAYENIRIPTEDDTYSDLQGQAPLKGTISTVETDGTCQVKFDNPSMHQGNWLSLSWLRILDAQGSNLDIDAHAVDTDCEDQDSDPESILSPHAVNDDKKDPDGNSIRAVCYEAGLSLSILDSPGGAGKIIDNFALKLNAVIDRVYDDYADKKIRYKLGSLTEPTMKQIFDVKLLKEIHYKTDQIGRCLDIECCCDKQWLNQNTGRCWLQSQLQMSSNDPHYTYRNMLTKIRMLSAFGGVCREALPIDNAKTSTGENLTEKEYKNNASILKKICGFGETNNFLERLTEFLERIRHKEFDAPSTRARDERPPLDEHGRLLSCIMDEDNKPKLQNIKEIGFGNVYGPESFGQQVKVAGAQWNEKIDGPCCESYFKYMTAEKIGRGRQGMNRQGQPIDTKERPCLLAECCLEKVDKEYSGFNNLMHLLNAHQFHHGPGANRWYVYGSYAKESRQSGLPAAGSQSGGSCDILLGLHLLTEEGLFGNSDILLPAGLFISAFMNFGAYHSFNETYPIVQAMAHNTKFIVSGTRNAADFYKMMANEVCANCGDHAKTQAIKFYEAYECSSSRTGSTTAGSSGSEHTASLPSSPRSSSRSSSPGRILTREVAPNGEIDTQTVISPI